MAKRPRSRASEYRLTVLPHLNDRTFEPTTLVTLETAQAFAAEGCRVAMCARNKEALSAVADGMRRQHNIDVLAEALDVTDADAVRDFVEEVAATFGAVDICVTNAGGPPAKGFLATTMEEWKRAIDLNFMSAVYFAHAVIPHMQKKKWGRIITITSVTTKQPVTDLVYSNAVRAAVVGLVKSLANEFGKDGILVNNVGPFLVKPLFDTEIDECFAEGDVVLFPRQSGLRRRLPGVRYREFVSVNRHLRHFSSIDVGHQLRERYLLCACLVFRD